MKTMLILSLVVFLLICTTIANAQTDTTLYKIKYEKFKAKAHNGKIITIIGGSAIVVGAITGIVGLGLEGETRDSLYPIGFGLAGAGLVTTIVGSINWSVGNKKTREYKIRLDDARTGFYYNPKGVGVTLAFKF